MYQNVLRKFNTAVDRVFAPVSDHQNFQRLLLFAKPVTVHRHRVHYGHLSRSKL